MTGILQNIPPGHQRVSGAYFEYGLTIDIFQCMKIFFVFIEYCASITYVYICACS